MGAHTLGQWGHWKEADGGTHSGTVGTLEGGRWGHTLWDSGDTGRRQLEAHTLGQWGHWKEQMGAHTLAQWGHWKEADGDACGAWRL